jgi:arylsulfatase A-like enzyme
MVLQLDRLLAEFFTSVDQQVGLDKTLVVFSGGHGLPPLPENARRLGMPAGRVSGESIVQAMNTALAEHFGPTIFVEKYVYPFVYLNDEAHSRPPDVQLRIIAAAGEAARRLPGVAGYYSPNVAAIAPPLEPRLRRSWYSPRSGDFLLVYEPYYVESYSDGRGTTSGSLYRYDTDVPLIFLGKPFKAAQFAADVDATSIAPTLSTVLGIPAPSSATGTVLGEAIMAAEPPPSGPAPAPVSRRTR